MAKAWWKQLPPEDRQRWLETEEARRALGDAGVKAALHAISRETRAMEAKTCSAAWLEDWRRDRVAYPPPADTPACQMKQAGRPAAVWQIRRGGVWRQVSAHRAAQAATDGFEVRLIDAPPMARGWGFFPGEGRTFWPAYYVSSQGATVEYREYLMMLARSDTDRPSTSSVTGHAIEQLGNTLIDGASVRLSDQIAKEIFEEDVDSLVMEIAYYDRVGELAAPLPLKGRARKEALSLRLQGLAAAARRELGETPPLGVAPPPLAQK